MGCSLANTPRSRGSTCCSRPRCGRERFGESPLRSMQSRREGDEAKGGPPGSGWAYNDVRVNLLCLALTELWRQPLGEVLAERVMQPSVAPIVVLAWLRRVVRPRRRSRHRGRQRGAHWGGGCSCRHVTWPSSVLHWLEEGVPCSAPNGCHAVGRHASSRPSYGYLWWLNDQQTVFPIAPKSGRCAREMADVTCSGLIRTENSSLHRTGRGNRTVHLRRQQPIHRMKWELQVSLASLTARPAKSR